jgi:DUF1009 family protein
MEQNKLGIIMGNGNMPLEIINHCISTKREVFIVGIEPFATDLPLAPLPHIFTKIGEVGKLFKALKDNNVTEIVFAGGIKRPTLSEIKPDWEGAKLLTKLAIKKMNDDNLLDLILKEIECQGFKVLSIQDIIPEMLFSDGIYGKIKPTKDDMDDINRGIEVAKALGSVSVGQAVVVQEGIVLAVEAVEGTDMMLARANSLKRKGKAPIMVKIVKPGQDKRVDMPVIGIQTIEQLVKYEIGGIAVEANGILLIEREAVIKAANEKSKFLIGMRIQ